jgi:succinoglycan biosynthesis protein ExoA
MAVSSPTPARPAPASTRALVVVPTLNEAEHIEQTLASLCSAPATLVVRVVVVDGGSTDDTRARVRHFARTDARVVLLDNPARLQSAGVNLAVQRYGHEAQVLIRCDAHARYPARFCERAFESLVRSGADALVVVMDTETTGSVQRAIGLVQNSIVGTGGSAHRAGRSSGFVDHGHHAAFWLDTFRRVGGYDATYSHNEDAEYDCRQRKLGARIFLDASLRLRYVPRDTLGALARQYYRYGRGRARTVVRHPSSLRARQLAVPVNALGCALGVLGAPLLPPLFAWPLAYLTGLLGTSLYFAVRERSAIGLLTGPTAFLMHTGWALGFLHGLATAGGAPAAVLLSHEERPSAISHTSRIAL